MTATQQRLTHLLESWSGGDEEALTELLPLVYDELRELASSYMRRERRDHTLETGALIHEAYMRLAGQRIDCRDRTYFFAISARVMRQILVEHARRRGYRKRGSGRPGISLDEALVLCAVPDSDMVDLDEALDSLAEVSPEQARVVELRFFGGLKAQEIAEILGISPPTVTRRWRVARAWLYRYLTATEAPGA